MEGKFKNEIQQRLIGLGINPHNIEVKVDWLRDNGKPIMEQYYQRLYITINDTVIQRVIFTNELDKWFDAEITQIINMYTGYDKMQATLPYGIETFKPLPQYKDKDVIRLVESFKETPNWKIFKRMKLLSKFKGGPK